MSDTSVPRCLSRWFMLVFALATVSLGRAEIAPPTQDHVAAIGRSPL